MSLSNNRRAQPGRMASETLLLWVGIGLVVAVLATVYAAVKLGHRLAGLPAGPRDPWTIFFGVLQGDVAWPVQSTVVAAAAAAVLLLLTVLVGAAASRRRFRASRVDHAARYMGRGRDV